MKTFPRLLLIFIIAIFFEYSYIQNFHHGNNRIYFHIIDFSFTDINSFFKLEILYFVLMFLMCWEKFLIPCGMIAGIVCLSLINLDLTERYQFEFLAPFIFIGFTLSSLIKRSRLADRYDGFIFVAFVASVYAFASLHKIYTFEILIKYLPLQIMRLSLNNLHAICRDENCFLFSSMGWMVIPIITSMAILTSRKEWLRPRIILATVFHWGISASSHLWRVALLMLALHFYLACFQEPETAKNIFKNRRWWFFILLEAFFFMVGYYLFRETSSEWLRLIQKICHTNFILFPVIFLLLPFLKKPPLHSSIPFKNVPGFFKSIIFPRSWIEAGVSLYLFLLIAFGFSPFMTENNYAVLALGWTPASGGHEYTQIYLMSVPNQKCYHEPVTSLVINTKIRGDKIIYAGTRMADMERLKNMFSAYCFGNNESDPKLEIIKAAKGTGYQSF